MSGRACTALRSTAGRPDFFCYWKLNGKVMLCCSKEEGLHPRISEKLPFFFWDSRLWVVFIYHNQKLHPFVLTSFPNTTGSSYGYMTGTWQVLHILCGPGLWAHAPEKDHLQRSEARKFASHGRRPTQGAQLWIHQNSLESTVLTAFIALLPTFCRWQIWVTWLSTIATGQTGTAALIPKNAAWNIVQF